MNTILITASCFFPLYLTLSFQPEVSKCKPHNKSIATLNPLRSLFKYTMESFDSTIHLNFDTSQNFSRDKFRMTDLIRNAYKWRRFLTFQITVADNWLHESLHNCSIIGNKKLFRTCCDQSIYLDRKYSKMLVIDIYPSPHCAKRALNHFSYKVIPNIVLLYFDQTNRSDSTLAKIFQQLQIAPLTSIFIALHNNYSHLSILCFTCETGFEKVANFSGFNYHNLLSKWTVLNRDLRTARVSISIWEEPAHFALAEISHCNIHSVNVQTLRTFEDLCLHRIIQKFLNYTFNPYRELSWRLSTEHGGVDTQVVVDSIHVERMLYSQFDFISSGMTVDPYVFFTTLNPADNEAFVMLRPFDASSWIVLIVALFGYSAILFFMPLVARNVDFFGIAISLLGTIPDQPANTVYKVFKISRMKPFLLMVAWTLWSAMVLEVGKQYKGALVSLLTAGSTPDEPSNLLDLLNSNLPLITRDGDNIENENLCAIRDLYLPDILVSIEQPIPESNVFKRLHDSIKWVDAHLARFQIAVAFKKHFQLEDKNGSVDFSKNFAIIEARQEAEFRRHILNAFSDKWISKIYPLSNLLTSRQMTAVKRNYFQRFFTKAFSSVEEAGLFRRWATFAWNDWQAVFLRDAVFRVKSEARRLFRTTGERLQYRVNLPENIFGFIFTEKQQRPSSHSVGQMAMTMRVHGTTFFLLLILEAFGVLLFVLELVYNRHNLCCWRHSTQVLLFLE